MTADRDRALALSPAASVAELRAAPAGKWIGGPSFVYAWPTSALCASVLFGVPDRADLEALAALFALELAPPATPHASVIDARAVERVEPTAFAVLSEYVIRHREAMRGWVTRLAIVRPGGFVGALAAGFYETLEAPYPVAVFEAPEDAYAWVEADPRWIAVLAALRRAEVPPLLADLGRALEATLREASLESAARALGLSVRTLQRHLTEHGTTFRRELREAQVRVAERWLAESDEPITRIAYEVGCGTPQRLSALFREARGLTPTGFRAATRPGRA